MTDHCYADMMIIKKSVLLDLMELGERTGEWDLMDMIKSNLDTLRVYGAPHSGYINRVHDLAKYYEANMDLLEFDIMKELFLSENSIHTKIKDNHPTLYQNEAVVRNSIVGSGCEVEGKIYHSVLFRDSKIGYGSEISNSIIMQKAEIGNNVKLNYVIFDKDVKIRNNASLVGTKDNPIVLSKGMVI